MVLGDEVEKMLVDRLKTCAEWGFPMDSLDLRMIVQEYLNKRGISLPAFKDNMLSADWARSFMERHQNELTVRICQNIKRSRAKVSPEILEQYFENLADTLEGVPPSNIMNYDETNLSNDPGRKRVIMKRGTKYPERIMDSPKSSVSLMYAGCADGTVLPPYVVYKALHMYDSWTMGGRT